MNVRKLVLLLLVLLCSACAALHTVDQLNKFDTSLGQYGSALRWGRYLEAYNFHIRKDNTQPRVDIEKLEKFSITSFNILERNSLTWAKKDFNNSGEVTWYWCRAAF